MEAASGRARALPRNIEAEQSTLGAMLIDREAVAVVAEVLKPEDFYQESHKILAAALYDLYDRSKPIDIITVTEALRQRDHLEAVGGAAYLTLLIDLVPAVSNVRQYAEIVMEKALLRNLIMAGDRIQGWCYNEEENAAALVDRSEQEIFKVGQRRTGQSFFAIKPLLTAAFEQIDQQYHNKGSALGLSTGYYELDELTSGLQKTDLIIIAARPSMGKTALTLNIAQHAAVQDHATVAIFSLEMSKEQLVQRLICSTARVDASKLRTGYLHEDDWGRIGNAVQLLYDAPIYIDDTPGISSFEIRGKARRLHAEHPLDLIVVDYLQLVTVNQRVENRVQEVSQIAQSLKSLARELRVPVIACAQLSRQVEQRDNKRPMLSDLRESGSIEAEADLVMFIYRPKRYEQRSNDSDPSVRGEQPQPPTPDIGEIIIGKQRNGPIGTVELAFIGQFARFENLAREPGEAPAETVF